jgi:hypothetical protein
MSDRLIVWTVYNVASKMRLKILGWIGVVWGGFVLINGVVRAMTAAPAEEAFGAGQLVAMGLGLFMLLAGIHTLRSGTPSAPRAASLPDFATRYTAAWCSQNAATVAAYFAKHGSLTINRGKPAVGRAAITAAAQNFMTAFPDMVVTMDRLEEQEGEGTATYHWTLTGTNTGPGGTGKPVRISGYEEWVIGSDGLIVDSLGYFDEADYQHQLNG